MDVNNPNYTSFRIAVSNEFQEVFSHFYFAANHTEQSITRTLYPTYQTIMIFNFGSKASLVSQRDTKIEMDKCLILGPIKQAFEYTLPVGSEILVANFKNDAFYRFFGNAILSDYLPFNPDQLLDENCFTNVWHELNGIHSVWEKVDFILTFCKPYLKDRDSNFEPIANFSDETHSQNPIKAIAGEINKSERSVQLNYKKFFRYSSKDINRYHRFLKATELIQNSISDDSKPDWFEIISQCGYYDQSQLIHDFRHFINLTPNQFLKFQQDICYAKPE